MKANVCRFQQRHSLAGRILGTAILLSAAGWLVLQPAQATMIGGPYQTNAATVNLYHLDETSGGTASDATANHYDGTLGGATAWTGSGAFSGGLQSVIAGGTTGGYFTASTSVGATFTMEGMFNISQVSDYFHYLLGLSDGTHTVFARLVTVGSPTDVADYKIVFGVNNGGDWDMAETAAGLLTLGSFYHIAVERDDAASALRIYLGRDLVASSATANPFAGTTGPLVVGAVPWAPTYNSTRFLGTIDEIRVSNAALGPEDFVVAPEPGLLALLGLGALLAVRARRR